MKNIYPVFFTKTDTVILVEVPELDVNNGTFAEDGMTVVSLVDIDFRLVKV